VPLCIFNDFNDKSARRSNIIGIFVRRGAAFVPFSEKSSVSKCDLLSVGVYCNHSLGWFWLIRTFPNICPKINGEYYEDHT